MENDGPVGNSVAFIDTVSRNGGVRRWTLDTKTTDIITALSWGPDGVLFASRTRGALDGVENRGGFDLVLGELNNDGALAWIGRYGLAPGENPRRIAEGTAGQIVAAGYHELYIPSRRYAQENEAIRF